MIQQLQSHWIQITTSSFRDLLKAQFAPCWVLAFFFSAFFCAFNIFCLSSNVFPAPVLLLVLPLFLGAFVLDSTLAFFESLEVLGLAGDSGGGRFALFFCDICGAVDVFDFDIG